MKNSWLEIAEYVSLAGSVVGSAVAVASQQVVYAAAPVSAALLLNVANRRRLEQQAEQNRPGEVVQVQQQLSREVESLRASVRSLPSPDQLVLLQEAIQAERQRLERLETSNLAGIEQDISRIQQQYAALQESILQKESRGESGTVSIAQIESATRQIAEKLAQLQAELSVQQQQVAFVQNNVEELGDRLTQTGSASTAAGASQQEIVQLRSALAQLEENVQNRVSQQDFTSLVSAIAALEQTVQPSRSAIAALEQQLDALSQQVNRQTAETFQSTILEQLEQVRSAIAALERRGAATATALSPVDLTGVEAQIAQLHSAVAEAKAELERRLQTLEVLELDSVPQAIAQLRHEYARLAESALSPAPETLPEISRFQDLENELAKALQGIARLQAELSQRPQPTAPDVQRSLVEFSSALQSLSERVAQLTDDAQNRVSRPEFESLAAAVADLEKAATPLSAAIAAVRGQLDTLSARVSQQAAQPVQASSLEQIEAVSRAIAAVEKRIDELPPPAEPVDLTGVEEAIARIVETFAEAKSQLENRIASLEALELQPLASDVSRLTQQYNSLRSALAESTARLHRLPEASKVDSLERAILHLQKRIDELPPPAEPVDLTGVEEAIAKIVEAVVETRSQLENRIVPLEVLNLPSVERDIFQLRQQYDSLRSALAETTNRLEQVPGAMDVAALERAILHLQQRLDALPSASESEDMAAVQEAIARTIATFTEAKAQLESRIAPLEEFVNPMRENISQLQEALHKVETEHIASVQRSLAQLQADVGKSGESVLAARSPQIEEIVKQAAENQVSQVNQLLKALQPYDYELVFDRPGIRGVLEEALISARERLIVVCPWLSRSSLDGDLLEKLEAFLQRNGCIDLGWGHLKDIEAGEFPRRINQQWQTSNLKNGGLYDALNDIERLRAKYPERLRLKVLGTHENFIVRDRDWALLTTHNFLSAGADFPEREVGVQTTDPRIVRGLIDRFEASAIDPSHAELIRKRGLERLDVGDYQGAIEDYTQVLAGDPSHAIAYNNRAIARYNLGDYQGAVEDCNRAVQLEPHEAAYYFNRGFARLNLQDYRSAIGDFSEVIRLKPADADAYFYRGEACRLSGEHLQAVADYTEALRCNPDDAVAYNNRGLVRYHLKDYPQAIENYTQALRINPDDAVAYFNRGVARSAIADYSRSIEDFSQALQRNPDYAAAYHNRGLARGFLSDKQGAIEDLQKAAELFSAKGETDSYQQALEALHKL